MYIPDIPTFADKSTMDDLTDCQICFEAYNLTDRTPRLLPCSHTVSISIQINLAKLGPWSKLDSY